MLCARTVFRCFRIVEAFADRVTGAAGPYFVGLAVVLITAGALCFFTIILPSLSYPLFSWPICSLIATNLVMHYWWACTVPPGFTDDSGHHAEHTGRLYARRRGRKANLVITEASISRCTKCGGDKPERTHHCRICKRCILKYDHHCPCEFAVVTANVYDPDPEPLSGINQCVGLYNERHFVLFMIYFVLSTMCLTVLGYPNLFAALGIYPDDWPHFLPPWIFVMIYLLSSVLCLAVLIMLSFHLWSIIKAETSVESHDFLVYRDKAKARGMSFVNCYDLGKRQNIELFFNVGPHGEYSYLTLIFPLRVSPYTNGRAWARQSGLTRHLGIEANDEFTDDEDYATA